MISNTENEKKENPKPDMAIEKFQIQLIKYRTNIIIGDEKSGKSFLIKDMVKDIINNNLNYVATKIYLIGDNPYLTYDNTNIAIKKLDYDDNLINSLKNIIEIQRKKDQNDEANHIYLIFENCRLHEDIKLDYLINDIMLNKSYYNITTILSIQNYPSLTLPICEASNFFIFPNNSQLDMKKLYNDLLKFYSDFEMFTEIIKVINEYECIVISGFTRIDWYKADFKLDKESEEEENNDKKNENIIESNRNNKENMNENGINYEDTAKYIGPIEISEKDIEINKVMDYFNSLRNDDKDEIKKVVKYLDTMKDEDKSDIDGKKRKNERESEGLIRKICRKCCQLFNWNFNFCYPNILF